MTAVIYEFPPQTRSLPAFEQIVQDIARRHPDWPMQRCVATARLVVILDARLSKAGLKGGHGE